MREKSRSSRLEPSKRQPLPNSTWVDWGLCYPYVFVTFPKVNYGWRGVTEEGIQKKDGHQKGGVCVVVFRVELKCWWEPNVERSTWIKHTTYYVVPDIEWRRQKVRKAQKNAQLPMIRYPRIITYSSPRLDTASDPKGPGALRWNRNTRCTPSTAAQRYEIKDQRTWSEYQHRKFS